MSGFGGAIAGAVGKQITTKLGKFASEEITLQWGFREEVADMEEKMKDLVAVLHDADDKCRRVGEGGKVFQRWTTKFKGVAHDVEDVLDELDANELIKKSQPKVKLWFSRNNQLLQRLAMPHKMKNVRKKIDKLIKDGQLLNLVPHQALGAEGSTNTETFAANIGEGMRTGMVGRDLEKEKIISLLLKSEADEDISIVPIVGLGGIGKTTLAESVLADKRVTVFDVSAWVSVSKQFDLHKIGCAIMKSVNSNISLSNCSLQFLHDNLKKELATRRYLIVLDGLWEEDGDKLEELKRMLQYGCRGSRIIVTTRNLTVVQKLRTGVLSNDRKICPVPESHEIKLDVLSADDCWELMKKRAFGPDDHQSVLEEIGRQIAVKCGGLPLVANALGQVMSELRSVRAWEDIRDTKVDLGLREVRQMKTLESLMLSYYYMKLDFKMCFIYLAAFPKGSIMDINHLIQQWNALGYIYPGYDGQRCINYLLGMSFLQIPCSPSVSPSPMHARVPREIIMHDLVHDLASIIAADEFIELDATNKTNWNRARYCRHAQLTNYKNNSEVFKYLPGKGRSLHFRDSVKLQLPQKAFSRSKYMRVLDLGGSAKVHSASSNIVLPSSINQLKLLRYLDATGLPITSLPKSFHTLQNIETLILSNCSLETLPDNFCRLGKLYYLDLSGCRSLHKLPASLVELSELAFLNLSGCSVLQELPESICYLACLWHLDMSHCWALQKLPDNLGSLLKLSFLDFSSCFNLTKLPDNVKFPSLEHLNLSNCHELLGLPKYFGLLKKLELLNLSDCYKVPMLPESFCQLDHLKYLDLSDCHNLKELPERFGNLLELEYLNLTSCSKLQILPESLCKLSTLRCLCLSHCVKLTKLPSSFSDLELQTLDISDLQSLRDLPDSIGSMTSLTRYISEPIAAILAEKSRTIHRLLGLSSYVQHHVHEIDSGRCSSIVELEGLTCSELVLKDLQNIRDPKDAERIKLRDKSDIRKVELFWQKEGGESVLEKLVPPRTLEYFGIYGYMSKDFPDWMSHMSSYLPSLSTLVLDDLETCDYLPSFGGLPNLRSLSMSGIPKIRKIDREFYGDGGPCIKLRVLTLGSMENLVEWWTTKSGEESEEFLIPNLHHLQLENCPKLKFLPYPPRSMMWNLDDSNLALPEHGFGKLSSSTLPFAMNICNGTFSEDKWDRLEHFSTLEDFIVNSISGLRSLPEVIGCFTSLTRLYLVSLKDLETLPVWLGRLVSLEIFDIRDCCNLTCLPECMKDLTTLRDLTLMECKGIKNLPGSVEQLTSLEEMYIKDCPNITCLPECMKNLTALRDLKLIECKGLEKLPGSVGQLTSLKTMFIKDCANITFLPESMENLTSLRDLKLIECKALEELPRSVGQLTSLEEMYIKDCPNIKYLPESMENLTALRDLKLIECKGLEELPGSVGQLTSLKVMYIKDCPNIKYLPESMENLTALRELSLIQCKGLQKLPECLGQMTSLEEIHINDCPNLTSLPESIQSLTALKKLHISECPSLIAICEGDDANKICHIPTVELIPDAYTALLRVVENLARIEMEQERSFDNIENVLSALMDRPDVLNTLMGRPSLIESMVMPHVVEAGPSAPAAEEEINFKL